MICALHKNPFSFTYSGRRNFYIHYHNISPANIEQIIFCTIFSYHFIQKCHIVFVEYVKMTKIVNFYLDKL
ncbi:hypothetical protein BRYFOR_05016 [Marvinbryantia formatexigens DSM 14469]|uniref:Uncharacterized protein n=1 Tax=Marvinbryantia formatexigens DSM 14469 TaxID=478749 RepID=C6L8S6_9FIRM|nr:hypothetical protein BRYFOR_05016 [Marvinbryantia formatexigens DSM 14469]